MNKFIPISQPSIGQKEIKYVNDAMKSGWVSSIGDYIDKLLAFQMLIQLNDEFPKALLIPVNDVKLENID